MHSILRAICRDGPSHDSDHTAMNVHDSWLQFQPTFHSPSVFISSLKMSLQSGHFVKVFKEGNFLVGRILITTTQLDSIAEHEHGPWLDGQRDNQLGCFVKLNWFIPRSLLSFSHSEMANASCNIYVCEM
jgi:hypothetical protein